MALTRDEILARKKTGRTTERFPIGDGEVIIRGLTRDEALQVRGAETLAEKDNVLISCGLVDPEMTPADVAEWAAEEDAGLLGALSQRIGELSGLVEGAGKSRVSRPGKRR